MTETVVVALIALAGTALGTFGGILTSSKLTNYRIEQLEKKVDKHNNFATKIPILQNDFENLVNRVDSIEKKVG